MHRLRWLIAALAIVAGVGMLVWVAPEQRTTVLSGKVFDGIGDSSGGGCGDFHYRAQLTRLDPLTGHPRWQVEIPPRQGIAPALVVGDALVVAGQDNTIAVSAETGKSLWQWDSDHLVRLQPAEAQVVAWTSSAVTLKDAQSGETRWEFKPGGDLVPPTGPASASAELVYVGQRDSVVALRIADGTPVWRVPVTPELGWRQLAVQDPIVLVDGGQVRGLDPATGHARWTWSVPPPGDSHLEVVDRAGEVILLGRERRAASGYGESRAEVFALNANTGEQLSHLSDVRLGGRPGPGDRSPAL